MRHSFLKQSLFSRRSVGRTYSMSSEQKEKVVNFLTGGLLVYSAGLVTTAYYIIFMELTGRAGHHFPKKAPLKDVDESKESTGSFTKGA